jgi:hypothetical protein
MPIFVPPLDVTITSTAASARLKLSKVEVSDAFKASTFFWKTVLFNIV